MDPDEMCAGGGSRGDWFLDPAQFVYSHIPDLAGISLNYVDNEFLAGENSIVVETPSVWVSGSSATIRWDEREASSPQSGISEACFAQLLAADGSVVWTRSQITTSSESQNITVPSVTAGSYRLLIHAWSENGEFLPIDGHSAPFEIVSGLPIQILSPLAYDIWSIGEDREIMWQPAGTGDVLIEASADGGSSWRTIAGPVPNSGVFNWTVTGPASPSSMIRVSTLDGNFVGTSTSPYGVMWPNAFSVTPAALDFGVVPYPPSGGWVWDEVRRTFQACNSSPDMLYAYPTVDRELFWLDATIADGIEIPPYDCVTCEVTFAALWPGDHVAQVWFRVAEYSPQSYGVNVELSGAAAQWPFAMYDSHVWFGEIAVGESLDVTCTIFNQTGDDYSLLTGDPAWWNEFDDQGQFALVGGGGPFALAPGESHTLRFRFTPNVAGEHVATMDLQLPVSGGGGMNVPLECHGFATLNFGSVAAGTAIDDTLSIRNNTPEPLAGSLTLTGEASLSALAANLDCQAFAIVAGGGDYDVAPGPHAGSSFAIYPPKQVPTPVPSRPARARLPW
ncbi:MAG: choice-of-anchor D domain-containing protein [bacterium]|nr:choice-of-anchor D domain-containing protein [bacterium]